MKTETDIMNVLRLACDFYNAYRETLGYTHEQARAKVEFMYHDLHEWIYGD